MLHVPYFSLRQLELGNPVAFPQVGFPAGCTAVPDVDLLCGLVATRDLRELAHVAHFTSTCFLAVDPVETGRLALLDLLHLMDLMTSAKRTVCFEFHWHLHCFHRLLLDIESQYYLLRFIFKIWVHRQYRILPSSLFYAILIVAKSGKVLALGY